LRVDGCLVVVRVVCMDVWGSWLEGRVGRVRSVERRRSRTK
jgi:hypothetical protein